MWSRPHHCCEDLFGRCCSDLHYPKIYHWLRCAERARILNIHTESATLLRGGIQREDVESEYDSSYPEAYSEPNQTSKTEFFFQNSERLKAVNYFCKKVPSYMCVVSLNAALYWHFCRDPNHIETSPLICIANQWIGFYMIGNSVMKELSSKRRSSRDVKLWYLRDPK